MQWGSAEVIDGSLRGVDLAKPCTLVVSSYAPVLYLVPQNYHGISVGKTTGACAFIASDTVWNGYWTQNARQAGYVSSSSYSQGLGFISQYSAGDGIVASYSGGNGLRILGAARHGIRVENADSFGLYVRNTNRNAVMIDSCHPGFTPVWVRKSGYNAFAVESTGNDGLWVTNANRYGLFVMNSGNGAYVNSNNGRGGYFCNNNNTYYALTAYNATGTGSTVRGLYVQGHCYASGGWQTLLSDGGTGYSVVSPDLEIITSGTGRLFGGTAEVKLETQFQDAVSSEVPLKVIVTPTAKCNGLFVDRQSADGFTVRELLDGTPDATFTWIAIGRLKGYEQRPIVQPGQPIAITESSEGNGQCRSPSLQPASVMQSSEGPLVTPTADGR